MRMKIIKLKVFFIPRRYNRAKLKGEEKHPDWEGETNKEL
jgi:hypothetical protein